MTLTIRVYDKDKKSFVYTHETESSNMKTRKDIESMYSDLMTARFIITLASLTNKVNYELFRPFEPQVEVDYNYESGTITYIVKESK